MTPSPARPAAVVLVHGAWAGSWIWGRVSPLLAERGIDVHAVDLPSCSGGAPSAGLREDEAAVRAALERADGDVVLCGHSYGGMAVTGAAAGRGGVRRLLCLCAFMPDEGESLLGLLGGIVPPFWRIDDDHMVTAAFDETAQRASGLDPEDRQLVAGKRVPQSLRSFTQPPCGIAWRSTPSTYAVCTKDASLPVDLQRTLASRAAERVELPTGHQPMLTHPGLVADVVARLAFAST